MRLLRINNLLCKRGFSTSQQQFHKSEAMESAIAWASQKFDGSQVAQMRDTVTLIDMEDNVIGPISKVEAHLLSNLEGPQPLPPHRAFSLFLFNSKNELLLQQRSLKKVTFPGLWTNTCCSHPRHTPSELDVDVQGGNFRGIKRAVVRRSAFELGISEEALMKPEAETEDDQLSSMHVGSRILYYAKDQAKGPDAMFGEYELDYIVFAKKTDDYFQSMVEQQMLTQFNEDEIKATAWVSLEDFDDFLEERKEVHGEGITPWFQLLVERSLKTWWNDIIDQGFESGKPDCAQDLIVFK